MKVNNTKESLVVAKLNDINHLHDFSFRTSLIYTGNRNYQHTLAFNEYLSINDQQLKIIHICWAPLATFLGL